MEGRVCILVSPECYPHLLQVPDGFEVLLRLLVGTESQVLDDVCDASFILRLANGTDLGSWERVRRDWARREWGSQWRAYLDRQ
jgi:hypothetical protein